MHCMDSFFLLKHQLTIKRYSIPPVKSFRNKLFPRKSLTEYSQYTMMINGNTFLAKELLREAKLSWNDGVRLVIELSEQLPLEERTRKEQICIWRTVIQMGVEAWKNSEKTEFFKTVVNQSIAERSHLRSTTRRDLGYLANRFLRNNPEWENKPLRSITTRECSVALDKAFTTPSQLKKGRVFLHSIFSFGIRQEWCDTNPVARIKAKPIIEKEIQVLTPEEMRSLLQVVDTVEYGECAPAVGLMFWAGIRPYEVSRLTWEDIDLKRNVIFLKASHTKTGGPRQIFIRPPLKRWLSTHRFIQKICPANWTQKWKNLRRKAGFQNWTKDVLRHTFASYHYLCYGDMTLLQREMGHSSSVLLQTRYLNTRNLTTSGCKNLFLYYPEKRGEKKRL